MTNAPTVDGSTAETEVVKWYTRARRFPQLVGRTSTGGTIWGGPYTYTQVGVFVGTLVLGGKTSELWGAFGTVGNVIALFGVAYGLTLVIGQLPIGSRNPLWMAVGLFRACTASPPGRLAGRPHRLRRPHRAGSLVVVAARPEPAALASAPDIGQESPGPRREAGMTPDRPCAPVPARSNVQRLLAAAGSPQES